MSYNAYRANREKFAAELFIKFNEKIFENKLPRTSPAIFFLRRRDENQCLTNAHLPGSGDMSVTWNNRLNTTAGLTYTSVTHNQVRFVVFVYTKYFLVCKPCPRHAQRSAMGPANGRKARIELSSKVLDTYGAHFDDSNNHTPIEPFPAWTCSVRISTPSHPPNHHIHGTQLLTIAEKLKQTLCHEMCHAAAWLVHGVCKPPHGAHFKHWCVLSTKCECSIWGGGGRRHVESNNTNSGPNGVTKPSRISTCRRAIITK